MANNQNNDDDDDTKKLEEEKQTLAEEHKALLEQMVAEELKKMKENNDKAYKKLDEITRENTRLKDEAKERQRKQLEDDGQHLEVANLKLSEAEEKSKILQEKLVSITRDRELERVLGTLDFRNDFARDIAFRSILPELVQDTDGIWLHKTGASLVDYVKTFAKDPNKDFLFKTKENTGSGSTQVKNSAAMGRPAKLEGLTTAELLSLAEAGKLGSTSL